VRHVPPCLFFVGLAWFLTYPLGDHLTSGVIGRGAGDNLTFLWSFWHTAQAPLAEVLRLHTSLMFASLGTSLALYTGVPLLAGIAALVPHTAPVVSPNVAVMTAVAPTRSVRTQQPGASRGIASHRYMRARCSPPRHFCSSACKGT
jgi:hypothetical protein